MSQIVISQGEAIGESVTRCRRFPSGYCVRRAPAFSMYKTLLVPIDGSAYSARALPIAAALAKRTGATVHVTMVHDPSAFIPFMSGDGVVPAYDSALVQTRRNDDQALVAQAVSTLRADGVRAEGTLLEGTVVESVLEFAQQMATELTIMTTHGRGGFARLRLGSVTMAYLARATAPVLLIHGAGEESATKNPPALPTGNLLCALDGLPFAETMLPHAASFAEAAGMTLALFSVVVPLAIATAPFGAEAMLADPDQLTIDELSRRNYLHALAATFPPTTTARSMIDMSPARAIVEEAVRSNAGAIAIATHGRGGFARIVLGSVTDEVLRHTALPIFVYRPEK